MRAIIFPCILFYKKIIIAAFMVTFYRCHNSNIFWHIMKSLLNKKKIIRIISTSNYISNDMDNCKTVITPVDLTPTTSLSSPPPPPQGVKTIFYEGAKGAPKKASVSKKPQNNPPQKRIVTTTKKWKQVNPQNDAEYQLSLVLEMIKEGGEQTPTHKMIQQQIHQKLYNYRAQDILKGFSAVAEDPIDVLTVLHKLADCNNTCYYCKKPVQLLYEYVREPDQWTLERLDNKYGHTAENVVISCLHCNLRRRTMYHERYLFTKELDIKKI
jgi:hypothetical protein